MIYVTASFIVKNEFLEKFIFAAKECVRETRKEPGNIAYKLLCDIEQAGRFSFIEEWHSKADLDAHTQTEHFNHLISLQHMLLEPLQVHMYNAVELE